MKFEFATAARILFGENVLDQAGTQADKLGSRVLVVGGGTPARNEPLLARLADRQLPVSTLSVVGEPTVASVLAGVERARSLVIGMGGGNAIDALLTNPDDPFDYLEVIGRGRPLANPAAPLIAIPTTAGTGTEVTRNAVLAATEQGVKVSLRHRSMLPAVALVDPVLTTVCRRRSPPAPAWTP